MTKILMNILIWIKGLSIKDLLLILLAISLIITGLRFNHLSKKKSKTIIIYEDSIRDYENKLGESYAARSLIEHSLDSLKSRYGDLYKEYKSLRDNPIIITKIVTEYTHDTIPYHEIPISPGATDSLYNTYAWSYSSMYDKDNYMTMGGNVRVSTISDGVGLMFDNIRIASSMYVDVIENKKTGMLDIITKANNPNVKITNLEAVQFDLSKSSIVKDMVNKGSKKQFGIGLYAGYGISGYPIYDPNSTFLNRNVQFNRGFQIGVGLMWTPIKF